MTDHLDTTEVEATYLERRSRHIEAEVNRMFPSPASPYEGGQASGQVGASGEYGQPDRGPMPAGYKVLTGPYAPINPDTAAPEGDQRGMYVRDVETPQGMLQVPAGERGLEKPAGERELAGLSAGLWETGSSGAAATEWLARRMGFTDAGNLAHAMAISMRGEARHNTPEDPSIYDEFWQAGGSMMAFYVPGLGVQYGAGQLLKVAPRLANILGASAMATAEALTEAGTVYLETQEKGWSEDKASGAALKTFLLNLPLNYVTDKAGIFADQSRLGRRLAQGGMGEWGMRAGRAATAFLSEGLQESGQEVISALAKEERLDPKQIAKAGILGAIWGGVAGGLHGGYGAMPLRTTQGQPLSLAQAHAEGLIGGDVYQLGSKLLERGLATDSYETVVQVVDAVRLASEAQAEAAGLTGPQAITGSHEIVNETGDSLIRLYEGHDLDTLVHEWNHRIYEHMDPETRAPIDQAWADYGGKLYQDPGEMFSAEGAKLFLGERMDLQLDPSAYQKAKLGLLQFMGRVKQGAGFLPPNVEGLYREAVLAQRKSGERADVANVIHAMQYQMAERGASLEATSEDFEANPERMSGVAKIANMDAATGKVYAYRPGESGVYNHADIMTREGMDPGQTITGFMDKSGRFVRQSFGEQTQMRQLEQAPAAGENLPAVKQELAPAFYSTLGSFLRTKWADRSGNVRGVDPADKLIADLRNWAGETTTGTGPISAESWTWEGSGLLRWLATFPRGAKVAKADVLEFLDTAANARFSWDLRGGPMPGGAGAALPALSDMVSPAIPGLAMGSLASEAPLTTPVRAVWEVAPGETGHPWSGYRVELVADRDGHPVRYDFLYQGHYLYDMTPGDLAKSLGGTATLGDRVPLNPDALLAKLEEKRKLYDGDDRAANEWTPARDRELEQEDPDAYNDMLDSRQDTARDAFGSWEETWPDEIPQELIDQEAQNYLYEDDLGRDAPEPGLLAEMAWDARERILDTGEWEDPNVFSTEMLDPARDGSDGAYAPQNVDLSQVVWSRDALLVTRGIGQAVKIIPAWEVFLRGEDGQRYSLNDVYDDPGVLGAEGRAREGVLYIYEPNANLAAQISLFPDLTRNNLVPIRLRADEELNIEYADWEGLKSLVESEATELAEERAREAIEENPQEYLSPVHRTEAGYYIEDNTARGGEAHLFDPDDTLLGSFGYLEDAESFALEHYYEGITWGGEHGDDILSDARVARDSGPSWPPRPMLPRMDLPGQAVKWGTYQWKGEKEPSSYRELLIIYNPMGARDALAARPELPAPGELPASLGLDEGPVTSDKAEVLRQAREGAGAYEYSPVMRWTYPVHWEDTQGVSVHLRFNTRRLGGVRTLFIEELQSDQHQRGAKVGYEDMPLVMPEGRLAAWAAKAFKLRPDSLIVQEVEGVPDKLGIYSKGGPGDTVTELAVAQRLDDGTVSLESVHGLTQPPPAPHADTTAWALFGLKNALRYAALSGHEALAWTSGAMQVERWADATRERYDTLHWSLTTGTETIKSQIAEAEAQQVAAKERINQTAPDSAERNAALLAESEISNRLRALQGQLATTMHPEDRVQISTSLRGKVGQGKYTAPLEGEGEIREGARSMATGGLEELADKGASAIREAIANGETMGEMASEGLIGGKGHQLEYDQTMPREFKKYIKKWGGKVEVATLPVGAPSYVLGYTHPETGWGSQAYGTPMGAEAARDAAVSAGATDAQITTTQGGEPVWSVQITPEMKQAALYTGQAQFQMRPAKAGQFDKVEARARALAKIVGDRNAPLITPVDWSRGNGFFDVEWAPKGSPGEGVAWTKPDTPGGQQTPVDLPAKAFNINFARINAEEDILLALAKTAEAYHGEIDEARRGTITHEQTAAMADALAMTPEQLLQWRRGQAPNAEEALAARNVLTSSAEQLRNMAREVMTTNTAEARFAFQRQLAIHRAIQATVSGMTAEAGRSLGIFRHAAQSSAALIQQVDEIAAVLDHGSFGSQELAALVADLDSTAGITKFSRESQKATTWDMLMELWYFCLLSNPVTHLTNITSNLLTAMITVPERLLSAEASRAKAVWTGSQSVHEGEALASAWGLARGAVDAFRILGHSLLSLEAPQTPFLDTGSKLEGRVKRAISPETFGLAKVGSARALTEAVDSQGMGKTAISLGLELIGALVRLPGSLLQGADVFFKVINYKAELYAQAFRQAYEKGMDPKEAWSWVEALAQDPSESIAEQARQMANINTFQNPLGDLAQGVSRIVNYEFGPLKAPLLRLIVPFVRTPANLLQFTTDRTPIALLKARFWNDMQEGGAKADLAVGRLSAGLLVAAMLGYWWEDGKFTGAAPREPGARALWDAKKLQEYSIKIGDDWHGYKRMDPWGTILGMSADTFTILAHAPEMKNTELVGAVAIAFANAVTSRTWMQGISEMNLALSDPNRYGGGMIKRLAGSVVPAGVAQAERVVDPALRETKSIVDHMLSRVPGWSADLPPKRDLFGHVRISDGAWGPDMLSPVYLSTERDSPALDEMRRLKLRVGMPSHLIRGAELPPAAYSRYVELAGQEVKLASTVSGRMVNMEEALNELVSSEDYRRETDGPEGGKALLLRQTIYDYRRAAQDELIDETPALAQAITFLEDEKARKLDPYSASGAASTFGSPIPTAAGDR